MAKKIDMDRPVSAPDEVVPPGVAQAGIDDLEMAKLTVAERDLVTKAMRFHRAESVGPISNAWELGNCVKEASEGANYGSGFVAWMASALAVSKSHLYKRQQLAEDFSREQITELSALCSPKGAPITLTHIFNTLSLPSVDERIKVLQTAAAESWTTDRVTQYVREHTAPSGRQGTTGPKITVPANVDEQAAQIVEQLGKVLQRCTLWAGDETGLWALIKNVPVSQLSAEWRDKAQAVYSMAVDCRDALDKIADQMEEADGFLNKHQAAPLGEDACSDEPLVLEDESIFAPDEP